MKMRWLKHPRTGEIDPILSITAFVVVLCTVKFFFEGVTLEIAGHVLSLGHADSLSYGAILGPVLGAQGAREWRIPSAPNLLNNGTSQGVDNPDAD